MDLPGDADGYLGLAVYADWDNTTVRNQNFLWNMVHVERTIQHMLFSVYITTDVATKSFVMFGGYDEELIKEGTNI